MSIKLHKIRNIFMTTHDCIKSSVLCIRDYPHYLLVKLLGTYIGKFSDRETVV